MPPGCLTASVALCRDVADRVLLYHLNTGPDWQCQQHLSLRRCTGQSKQGVQDPQTAVFLTKCDSSVSKTSMKPSTHHAVKTFMLFWLWIFVINSNVKESALLVSRLVFLKMQHQWQESQDKAGGSSWCLWCPVVPLTALTSLCSPVVWTWLRDPLHSPRTTFTAANALL